MKTIAKNIPLGRLAETLETMRQRPDADRIGYSTMPGGGAWGGMDYQFRAWPNRASLKKSIDIQARGRNFSRNVIKPVIA